MLPDSPIYGHRLPTGRFIPDHGSMCQCRANMTTDTMVNRDDLSHCFTHGSSLIHGKCSDAIPFLTDATTPPHQAFNVATNSSKYYKHNNGLLSHLRHCFDMMAPQQLHDVAMNSDMIPFYYHITNGMIGPFALSLRAVINVYSISNRTMNQFRHGGELSLTVTLLRENSIKQDMLSLVMYQKFQEEQLKHLHRVQQQLSRELMEKRTTPIDDVLIHLDELTPLVI